jgi:hypothetical protein
MPASTKREAPHRMSLDEIEAVREGQRAIAEGRYLTFAQFRKRVRQMIARGPRPSAKPAAAR